MVAGFVNSAQKTAFNLPRVIHPAATGALLVLICSTLESGLANGAKNEDELRRKIQLLAATAGYLTSGGDADAVYATLEAATTDFDNNGVWFLIPIFLGGLSVADYALTAQDAYELTQAGLACDNGDQAACQKTEDLAKQLALEASISMTIGNLTPGDKVGIEIISYLRKNGDDDVVEAAEKAARETTLFKIDSTRATKGTAEYDILNNPPANTRVELDNGTKFKTNEAGYVEEISYQPVDSPGVRDGRQTLVGKEGISGDVGGHIQACRHGGTCHRFNLFPQNANFNNGAYRQWENEITNALQNGDEVGL